MQIAANAVVFIHYTLKDDAGTVIDSSSGGSPLAYLHGNGNLVAGLEKALEGRKAGDKLQVAVKPEEGYGVRDESLVQQMPRRAFKGVREIRPGMRFNSPAGPITVTKVQGDLVTVDGNHELAGVTLNFEVEVTQVREATGEEILHGHVHGEGGHHH